MHLIDIWMHPNQSLDTLISLTILKSRWRSAAPFLASRQFGKAQNTNLSSKSAPLIPTESTSKDINPNTTHNSSNRSDEGLTLETSAFSPLWWLIYVFNSVVNT